MDFKRLRYAENKSAMLFLWISLEVKIIFNWNFDEQKLYIKKISEQDSSSWDFNLVKIIQIDDIWARFKFNKYYLSQTFIFN